MGATRLVLVRHGEARYLTQEIIPGPKGCAGLTDRGRLQAQRLGERLTRTREIQVDVALASVLPRAVETAAIVLGRLGTKRATLDCDLCEVHMGELDGLTMDQARARFGWPDGSGSPPPGGETIQQFGARVSTAVERLVAEHDGGSIVLFTHGGFISAACYHLLGVPWDAARARRTPGFFLEPEHTAITEWTRADVGQPWVLHRYNDAAHLSPA